MPSPPASSRSRPDERSAPSQPPDGKKRGRFSRISNACEACRKRKTKCTGGPAPCDLCRSLGIPCVVDLDMRRKFTIQRTLDEAKIHEGTLTSLLESIRNDDPNRVSSLVQAIRSHASVQEAAAALSGEFRRERKRSEDSSGLEDVSSRSLDSSTSRRQSNSSTMDDKQNTSSSASAPSRTSTNRHTSYDEAMMINVASPTPPLASHDWTIMDQILHDFHVDLSSPDAEMDGQFESWQSSPMSTPSTYTSSQALRSNPESSKATQSQRRSSISSDSRSRIEILVCKPRLQRGSSSFADPQLQFANFRIPLHFIQPQLLYDNSPISRVYTDYLHAARRMIGEGTTPSDVLGSGTVVVDLFFRERQASDKYTCCSWSSEVMRNFPGYDQFVGLACCYLLCRLMQWLLVPTAENYDKMPAMIRPTPSQLLVPHVAGIDICPVPAIRDALLPNPRDWQTTLMRANCSINWPHPMGKAVQQDPISKEMRLTKEFEDHAANYENWSVEPNILQEFPEIAGLIKIEDGREQRRKP